MTGFKMSSFNKKNPFNETIELYRFSFPLPTHPQIQTTSISSFPTTIDSRHAHINFFFFFSFHVCIFLPFELELDLLLLDHKAYSLNIGSAVERRRKMEKGQCPKLKMFFFIRNRFFWL